MTSKDYKIQGIFLRNDCLFATLFFDTSFFLKVFLQFHDTVISKFIFYPNHFWPVSLAYLWAPSV